MTRRKRSNHPFHIPSSLIPSTAFDLSRSRLTCFIFGFFLSLFDSFFLLPGVYGDASDPIQLISFKTHSRFIMRLDPSVEAQMKEVPEGFSIFLKGVRLIDLGAPERAENQWKSVYESLSDSRLEALTLKEQRDGVAISGRWKFPTGKLALAHPRMITFEYRNLNPPQYVLDFWVKSGQTVVEAKADDRRKRREEAKEKFLAMEKERASRSIASEQQHALISEADQFCDLPLSETRDAFIEFYPVHQKVDFSKWFSVSTPDSDFEYSQPKGSSKEAQIIRLALKLYKEAKLGLVVRTLDFYEKEPPSSLNPKSRIEMKFLRANAFFKLGYKVEAEQILTKLMYEEKGTEVALRVALFQVGNLLSKKADMPALENFLWLIRNYPDHPLKWLFHLGAAECLYNLRQAEQAAREYRWVMDNAPDARKKSEAAFRMADLYLIRFQYEQALGVQYQALKNFREHAAAFPAFQVNRGETLYQLGQLGRARETFEQVLEHYPGYPEAWRAFFRLGEITAREAHGPSDLEQSRKWFSDTVNRFPFSPGATLARLRLIPCGSHGGFTFDLAQKFFSAEAKNFNGNGEVFMRNYEDLRALARVRTLISMGQEPSQLEQEQSESKQEGWAAKVIAVALEELKKVKTETSRKVLTLIANDFLRREILRLLAEGKKFEAIQTYLTFIEDIPLSNDHLDCSYLIRLSHAAGELGMTQLAVQLASRYDRMQGKIRSPDLVQTSFGKAKALWLKHDPDTEMIRSLLSQVPDSSEFGYQKELILGLLDQQEKKYSSAIQHLTRAELLSSGPAGPDSDSSRSIPVQSLLGQLYFQVGDLKTSLEIYRDLEKRLLLERKAKSKASPNASPSTLGVEQQLGVPPAPDLATVIFMQGDILEAQGRWGEVARTYSHALELREGGNRMKFQYARALMKTGSAVSVEKATQILEKLAQASTPTTDNSTGTITGTSTEADTFWQKLAQEALSTEMRKRSINQDAKEGKI